MSVAEATRLLGVGRARVYQLLDAGALEAVSEQPLRISIASVERRLQTAAPAGAQLAPLSAWAILALASGDAPFLKHVSGLLSDADRSRARSRLRQHRLLELAPRFRGRAQTRGFVCSAGALVGLLADARLMLTGASAGRLLGWELTAKEQQFPVEAYVAERELVDLVEGYGLERDEVAPEVLLRSVAEPWPFPAHARVVPELVAAIDLSESLPEPLRELGVNKLSELAKSIVPEWRQRPPRPRPTRPVVPSGPFATTKPWSPRAVVDELWDDRAEQDAEQLIALLFVAAQPLTRTQATELLHISAARLGRACRVIQRDPPRGIRLEEAGEQLQLVSAPSCAAVIERYLKRPAPQALSQAAREVLAIVAYEQPITRSDISDIRGIDSSAVVETLMARKLIAEDPRFGGRGRPAFLVTTAAFLEYFGLSSLSELPPRPTPEPLTISRPEAPSTDGSTECA